MGAVGRALMLLRYQPLQHLLSLCIGRNIIQHPSGILKPGTPAPVQCWLRIPTQIVGELSSDRSLPRIAPNFKDIGFSCSEALQPLLILVMAAAVLISPMYAVGVRADCYPNIHPRVLSKSGRFYLIIFSSGLLHQTVRTWIMFKSGHAMRQSG